MGGVLAIGPADLVLLRELRLDDDLRGPLITVGGLLLLAWPDRSRLVLAVAVLFAPADVVVLTGAAGAPAGAATAFAGVVAVLLRRRPGTAADTA